MNLVTLNLYNLVLRYPTLKHFILACVRNEEEDELVDFLFALETDENSHEAH